MNKEGGVFITVRDGDKKEIGEIAKKFDKMGFAALRHDGHRKRACKARPHREDCR